jgi:hypothetical protein
LAKIVNKFVARVMANVVAEFLAKDKTLPLAKVVNEIFA